MYYIRYEDLVTDPEPVLTELFKYLLEVPSIEGTVVEQRIKDAVAYNKQGGGRLYKLKKTTGTNLNKCLDEYSKEQMGWIKTELKEYLYCFGYVKQPGIDNQTAFFDYEEESKGENEGKFNRFKELNKQALESVLSGKKTSFEFCDAVHTVKLPADLAFVSDKLTMRKKPKR